MNGGGYAEYCLQDYGFATHLPDHWRFEEGAAVAKAFQTAHESIFTHTNLAANESILIHSGAECAIAKSIWALTHFSAYK